MSRRSLALLFAGISAITVTGAYASVRLTAAAAKGGISIAAPKGTGSASSDGYLVELSAPPLLKRTEILSSFRNANSLRQALTLTENAKRKTPQQALTGLKQSLSAAEDTLSDTVDSANEAIQRERESTRSAVQGILRRHGRQGARNGRAELAAQVAPTEDVSLSLTFNGFKITETNLTPQEVKEIEAVSGVKRVYPNKLVRADTMDTKTLTQAASVWEKKADGTDCTSGSADCVTGRGVRIGIIDTGIDYTHTDLGGCIGAACRVKGGYDFVNGDSDPKDDHGHGTHVASIAAGNGALRGMAPGADLYAYKVLGGDGSGYTDDIIAALDRAADPDRDPTTDDSMDIVNLSLGDDSSHDPDDPLSIAVDNLVNAGIVAVVAAGNSGMVDGSGYPVYGTVNVPGAARNAVTVGAVFKDKQNIPTFTSAGPTSLLTIKPDLSSFGVYICAAKSPLLTGTACNGDANHVLESGTSMAAPHVAGIAALMLQAHPTWTPAQVKQTLRDTANPLGSATAFNANYLPLIGYGLADASKAVLTSAYDPVRLDTVGMVPGTVDIRGSVAIPSFQSYTLSYLTFADAPIVIATGSTIPTDGVLARSWNASIIPVGYAFGLLLEVRNSAGRVHRDATTIAYNPSTGSSSSSSPLSSSSSSSSVSSSSSSSSVPSSSSSLSSSSSSGPSTAACSETDPTQDPSVSGMLVSQWHPSVASDIESIRAYEDHCGGAGHENELTQFGCLSSNEQGFMSTTMYCPSGCTAGKCNPQ